MAQDRPSFEELNAYVDNELSADRAADVARRFGSLPLPATLVAMNSRWNTTSMTR